MKPRKRYDYVFAVRDNANDHPPDTLKRILRKLVREAVIAGFWTDMSNTDVEAHAKRIAKELVP